MINVRVLNWVNKLFIFNYLLVCSFFILGWIGIVNHELWQDEMQAWIIATDDSSIANLLGNLKYGHTALWYLCPQFLNWLKDNPSIVQVVRIFVATTNIIIFVVFSPFTKLQKVLFAFKYFPFYEYRLMK